MKQGYNLHSLLVSRLARLHLFQGTQSRAHTMVRSKISVLSFKY